MRRRPASETQNGVLRMERGEELPVQDRVLLWSIRTVSSAERELLQRNLVRVPMGRGLVTAKHGRVQVDALHRVPRAPGLLQVQRLGHRVQL